MKELKQDTMLLYAMMFTTMARIETHEYFRIVLLGAGIIYSIGFLREMFRK